jgi:putative Mg2+ transporter-C (MgtC) family protein
MAAEAATLTVFVIAGNTLLRPVVNAINRIPLAGGGLEATYTVVLTADLLGAPALRDVLIDHLELMRYPVADTDIRERSEELAEIRATLVSTAAIDADLDAIVAHLEKAHGVHHATWEVHTQD